MDGNVMQSNDALIEVEGRSKAKVFISYSRKDMAFADRLEAVLKGRGFEPLIDRTEIYAFEEWWKRIEALITRADSDCLLAAFYFSASPPFAAFCLGPQTESV
jgi:hypothetical protein